MKKTILLLSLIGLVASAQAQQPSNVTNAPAITPPVAQAPTSPQSVLDTFTAGIRQVTNWVAYAGGGLSLKGNNRVAFGGVGYNFNGNVGLVLAEDYLWSTGGSSAWNAVRGGVTLQAPGHLLSFTGVDFLSKISTTVYAADCLAQPKAGDSIGNIVIAGVDAKLLSFGKWDLGIGGAYEKRSGQGNFDGNYVLGMVTFRRPF